MVLMCCSAQILDNAKKLNQQETPYDKQHRGTQDAYEAYFAGMDSSMQQKVALTTAHFPVRGKIADMGSGSGRGTFDLASLYHDLELVGVDINPISVQRAGEKFQKVNLSYVVGDISGMVFPHESLDGILNSSVLHHVTSFNDFDVNRVLATLDNQVAQLKPGGVIIIRDFVIPDGPELVYLDLPTSDGREKGSIKELSTAALFGVFAEQWRSSVNRTGGVSFVKLDSPREGYVRFKVALRTAAEFVLRKDYRADWDTEVLEEYTYLTQGEFEKAFRTRGMRIVTSRPLWNPWIVQNRFQTKFYLSDLNECQLPFPPTNYLIVGEKVSKDDGVELYETNATSLSSPEFLKLTAHRHKLTGKVYELVERPHQTIDILPWFERDNQLFVLAKKGFPRPIVNACAEQSRLSRASHSGFLTEPISAIVDSTSVTDEVKPILNERTGLSAAEVLSIADPFHYYTSPGGINEVVKAISVQIAANHAFDYRFPNYTSFRSAGSVRELDAQQVLRASHVGGMFDARLEINIYRLFQKLGRNVGPWIGAPIKLAAQDSEVICDSTTLAAQESRAFESCSLAETGSEFLDIKRGDFSERKHDGEQISKIPFEYVIPRNLSFSSTIALPVIKTTRGILVGLEVRDLPAVQAYSGVSQMITVPAWRLPLELGHLSNVPDFVRKAMLRDFNISVRGLWELGGSYFTSPGVTPEVVYPFVGEVEAIEVATSKLHFVLLEELEEQIHLIVDAHLLIAAHRAIHALVS